MLGLEDEPTDYCSSVLLVDAKFLRVATRVSVGESHREATLEGRCWAHWRAETHLAAPCG